MPRITFPLSVLVIVLLGLLHAVPAQAQPIRVFVALTGNDANPCTFASPCKSVQHAHDVVAAGGEVRMLDPGSYGLLTITKAISILGDGHGGIAAQSGNTAITINAGPNDAVNLRGLVIEGFGSGQNGIVFNTGKSLVIENCAVRNFGNDGLLFANSGTTSATLSVSNSYFADNATGIAVASSSSGATTASIDRVSLTGNSSDGLIVTGSSVAGTAVKVAVTDSVAGNNGTGFHAVPGTASSVILVLTRSTASGNTTGVVGLALNAPGPTAFVLLAQSTVTENSTGYLINGAGVGGGISSYGDNYIDANDSNVGTLKTATRQ